MNSRARTVCTGGLALIFMMSGCTADRDVSLQKGDRIVFLGDSITRQGVNPKGYVTLTAEAVYRAFPDSSVRIFGAGISGHRVPDCLKRLQRDVLSKDPTIVVIYIGINDVWHWAHGRGTTEDDFAQGLRDIIRRVREAGAGVILCTPSVIGEKTDGSNPFDGMLETYAGISRAVSEETGSGLLDLRRAFMEHLRTHNRDNAEKGVLTADGVHLNDAGNRFVAACMMRVLGVSGPVPL